MITNRNANKIFASIQLTFRWDSELAIDCLSLNIHNIIINLIPNTHFAAERRSFRHVLLKRIHLQVMLFPSSENYDAYVNNKNLVGSIKTEIIKITILLIALRNRPRELLMKINKIFKHTILFITKTNINFSSVKATR